ncbi:DNA-directed RNA polymerase III subunit Rpc5 [Cynara cardunculus var. scolymus]|uniref:DNA-directed RNA polymerase III subunit Rpc5 n=1 Tax=Cynara cardunculus var. scolymus TaxID=59895 RepID=A0A103YNC6_CYNCS|nr:DNA-directed RNA polymerase III subunit Rpc5 [Cynara cardunculus var. scolymus]
MDIDFDDLDGPSKAPVTKAGKFAPKNSKFKPAAKPKREQKLSVPLPESNPVTIPKVELDDSKPPQQEPPSIDSIYSKTEMDQPLHTDPTSHDANGSVKMDADATEMEIDNEQEPDDGDRVVREIDVFITSSVDADSKVYVLQYPLRQSWRPYELEERCEKVLSSSWKPPPANGYAVGILVGNESKPPGPVNEQNENTKEQWIPLKYHGAASELSDTYIGKMVAQPTSQIQFSMSPSDYIDSLCPATSNDKLRSKGPSRRHYLTLIIVSSIMIFHQGPPVHRFTALKHLAPNDNDADIFRVLQSHAQLVQGLWVAKSKLKYKKDVGKEVLLRNYVLLQFSKNPLFNEMQLPKIPSFSETIKGILDEFATRRDSCRDWKFKECPDVSFIKDYPDVVQAQKNIWDLVEPQINEFIFRQSSKHSIGDRRATSNSTNDVVPKTTNVPPSRTPMLDEAREALPKALQKVFQAYKVCSLNQIRQRLRDMAVSENTHRKGTREARAAAAAADAPQEELQKTLNQVAVNIHGNIVINLFLAEGPKGRLKKASIYAAASVKLNREITNVEYQKIYALKPQRWRAELKAHSVGLNHVIAGVLLQQFK